MVQYYDYNDYELLSYIRESDEIAHNILLSKYEPFLYSFAIKVYTLNNAFQYGLEVNDFVQAGRIALCKAIDNFNEYGEAKFFTYAKTCMERSILNVVRRAKVKKHQILNNSLSLYYENGNQVVLNDCFRDDINNPERVLCLEDSEIHFDKKLKDSLTSLELRVLYLKSLGYRYKEISDVLNVSVKSVSNAMQRVRKKFKEG